MSDTLQGITFDQTQSKPIDSAPNKDPARVKEQKAFFQRTREGKKKYLQDLIQKEKAKLQGAGVSTDILPLANSLLQNNKATLDAINDLKEVLRGTHIGSKAMGMTVDQRNLAEQDAFAALNDIVSDKIQAPFNAKNFEKIRNLLEAKFGKKMTEVERWKLRELIALDDWTTIATHAVPLLMEHGPKVVSWLWNKFKPWVSNKLSTLAKGGSEGMYEMDYRRFNDPGVPYTEQYQPFMNELPPRIDDILTNYSFDAVSPSALISYLVPHVQATKIQSKLSQKTAVQRFSQQIQVFVTTSSASLPGAARYIIYPQNSNAFVWAQYSTDLNVVSGTGSVSANFANTFTSSGTPASFKCNGMSVRFLTTLGSQANGQVELSGFNSFYNSAIIPQADLSQHTASLRGNAYAQYRIVIPFSLLRETMSFPAQTEYTNGACLILTGFPTATQNLQVGTLFIDYCYEFIIATSNYSAQDLEYPNQGPATIQLIRDVTARFPLLLTLDLASANEFAEFLLGLPNLMTYRQCMETIGNFLQKESIRSRQREFQSGITLPTNPAQGLNSESFDLQS